MQRYLIWHAETISRDLMPRRRGSTEAANSRELCCMLRYFLEQPSPQARSVSTGKPKPSMQLSGFGQVDKEIY